MYKVFFKNKIVNLKKVLRYIFIYGFRKTYYKIITKYYLTKKYNLNQQTWYNKKSVSINADIAIIGCGTHSFSIIAPYLKKKNKNFLRACFDIDQNKSITMTKVFSGLYAPINFSEILLDKSIKTIIIASNHNSHADYAIQSLKHNKDIFIEKPHVTSFEQLNKLTSSIRKSNSRVFIGFNRPYSKAGKLIKEYLNKQVGSLMINWSIQGHKLNDNHWYYNPGEGGRAMGNLSHWSDMIYYLVDKNNINSCEIIPASHKNSKSDFIVSILFSDKSSAVISFSAKGSNLDGVSESLSIQKGDLICNMENFNKLTFKVNSKKIKINFNTRDLGHENNLNRIFSRNNGDTLKYIENSALLFLNIQKAIETQNIIRMEFI